MIKIKNTFRFYFILILLASNNTITVDSQVTSRKLYWSATCGPYTGETNMWGMKSYVRLNDKLKSLNNGIGLDARRSYCRGLPANFAASTMAEDVNICPVSIYTFAPVSWLDTTDPITWQNTADGLDSLAISNFVKSIPTNREVYFGYTHEPEAQCFGSNAVAGHTPDLYSRAFAKFVNAVVSAGRSNVHPCLVLMTWTFDPQSNRNPEDFNPVKYIKPAQLKEVIAGLDGYCGDPLITAKGLFEPCFLRMQKWGLSRFGIFETSAHASGVLNERTEWVESLGQWVNNGNGIAQNIELVSFFNCNVDAIASTKDWFIGDWSVDNTSKVYTMIDDGTINAYANTCIANSPLSENRLLGVYDFTTGVNQSKASNVVTGIALGDITSTSTSLKFKFTNNELKITNWPSTISNVSGSCINIPISKLATAKAFNISKVDVTLRRAYKRSIQMSYGNAVNSSQITFAKDSTYGKTVSLTYSLLEGTVGKGVTVSLIPEVSNSAKQYLSIRTSAKGLFDEVSVEKIEVYGTITYPNDIITNNDSESESYYKVFVNSNNQITVHAPEKSQVDVCNLMGKQIKKIITSSANETISSSFLPGTYLVVLTVDGKIKKQKIVIR